MLTRFDELKLIAKCALGDDRRAFGVLVEEYQSSVRSFLLTLTLGDSALSEDLAQETFIKAYSSIRSFKGLAKFKTWLFRIAYNEYYSWMRKRHEERMLEDSSPTQDASTAFESSGDAQMDVKMALKALNDVERTIIILFYMEDQPMKKIAEIMGLPAGTIKSHLSRARDKMAKELKR